jgi:hypothetical protein
MINHSSYFPKSIIKFSRWKLIFIFNKFIDKFIELSIKFFRCRCCHLEIFVFLFSYSSISNKSILGFYFVFFFCASMNDNKIHTQKETRLTKKERTITERQNTHLFFFFSMVLSHILPT